MKFTFRFSSDLINWRHSILLNYGLHFLGTSAAFACRMSLKLVKLWDAERRAAWRRVHLSTRREQTARANRIKFSLNTPRSIVLGRNFHLSRLFCCRKASLKSIIFPSKLFNYYLFSDRKLVEQTFRAERRASGERAISVCLAEIFAAQPLFPYSVPWSLSRVANYHKFMVYSFAHFEMIRNMDDSGPTNFVYSTWNWMDASLFLFYVS